MIIFGQGAIRCHPYLLSEMEAASDEDAGRAGAKFDKALFAHIGFTISNAVRSLVMGLTGSLFVSTPDTGPTRRYYRYLSRMSSAFAFVADVALLMLGGELKRREKLSARFGDVLSHIYMASAVLKHYEDQGRQAEDLPLVHWALQDSLYTMQTKMEEILRNFPSPLIGKLLRIVVLPTGRSFTPPTDKLGHKLAKALMTPGGARERLSAGMFLDKDPADPIGRVEHAFELALAAEPLEARIEKALKVRINPLNLEQVLADAQKQDVISETEAEQVRRAAAAVLDALQVDEFRDGKAVDVQAETKVAANG